MRRPEPIKEGAWAGAYDLEAIKAALTEAQWADFERFMRGQTLALADDGRTIVYAGDFERWLRGLPPLD